MAKCFLQHLQDQSHEVDQLHTNSNNNTNLKPLINEILTGGLISKLFPVFSQFVRNFSKAFRVT